MFSPFFKHLLWRNSLKLKGTHLSRLGSAQHEGAAVTWTASTCVCFPFSFPPFGHQSKMESIRLYSSLVGNYSPESRCQSSSLIFFPFPCTSPLARPKPLLIFFFPAGFLLAGAPAIWGGTNGRNVAVEVSRALPRCWCPRAGLGLQLGLVGTAFAFPSQPRLRQGLVSVCPTSPPPDQALEQSRCCPHPCEQGRGECRGKEALPSGRTARTAHTNSAAGPGICSRLWSCKYLPLLLLKTCPRG